MDGLYDPTIQPTLVEPEAIRTALTNVLIPEAAIIILSYAVEEPYTWPRKPYMPGLLINGNKVLSRSVVYATPSRWIRIAAKSSVSEGAHRWRILTEFHRCADAFGSIAFGITKAPAGITTIGLSDWQNAATDDDVLVSTGESRDQKQVGHIFVDGSSFTTGLIRSTAKTAVSTVQFDPVEQTMTVGFRCYDNIIRDVVVALPDSDIVWRPCVTICGAVAATILAWSDE